MIGVVGEIDPAVVRRVGLEGRVIAATHVPLDAEGAENLDLGAFAVAPGEAHAAWGAAEGGAW